MDNMEPHVTLILNRKHGWLVVQINGITITIIDDVTGVGRFTKGAYDVMRKGTTVCTLYEVSEVREVW